MITKKVLKISGNIKETEYYDKENDSDAIIEDFSNGNVAITHLFVPEKLRGKGIGTGLLNVILKDADRECWKVSLTPTSYGYPEYEKRLIKFYNRFGFKYYPELNQSIRLPTCIKALSKSKYFDEHGKYIPKSKRK